MNQFPKWLSVGRLESVTLGKSPFESNLNISQCRSEFQRDIDAIIHSSSFRRLAYKTQVMLNSPFDFPRTRLTHSLETMGIGRQLARICAEIGGMGPELSRNFEDATAAACLCHDIGHPPFGHAAEKSLQKIVGGHVEPLFSGRGFDANKQNLRLVTGSNNKQKSLNLTFAVLDGIMKYKNKGAFYVDHVEMEEVLKNTGTKSAKNPICYLVEAADDIAYVNSRQIASLTID